MHTVCGMDDAYNAIMHINLNVDNTWWWELMVFFRKMVLAGIVVLFSDSTQYGAYIAVWFLEGCFMLHLLIDPYDNRRQNRLEAYGLLAAIITFNCGILYMDDAKGDTAGFMMACLYVMHIGMWALLVKSLLEEYAAEGRTAMILRAQHDIQLEEDVAEEFETLRQDGDRHHDDKVEKLAQLQQAVGAHLPFADDDLMDDLQAGTAPDIRAGHMELSQKLRDMRQGWKERYGHRGKHGKQFLVDEAHREEQQHTTPAEKWRQRKQLEMNQAEG